jgi:magnesium transporter
MVLEKKITLSPENSVYTGDRPALETDLSIIVYDSTSAEMKHLSSVDELAQYKDNLKVSWINICGLANADSIKQVGKLFDIHPLSIEDILYTEQQSKMELFEEYGFLSIKTIQRDKNFHHNLENRKKTIAFFGNKQKQDEETDEFLLDQFSIVVMENVLITFQEIPGGSFDGVRTRILENMGEIRKMGTDDLAYSIIDAIVDEYFLTLNHLEEDIEDFEERATKTSDSTFIQELQDTKKYLLKIKRAISPLRENIILISRHAMFFRTDELKPFLQDLNEHLSHAIAIVENYHEWLTNIMDVNLSVLSHQTNKVMKVLAIISTIFIPLTFIAGVYGMNFDFMPEIKHQFGYPVVLGGMGVIAMVMIIIFKIRRWFS